MGLLDAFRNGLEKSRKTLSTRISELVGGGVFDDDFYDELEAILLMADVGPTVTKRLLDELKIAVKSGNAKSSGDVFTILTVSIAAMLATPPKQSIQPKENGLPWVILIVGVNGSGKTTSIGKLAYKFRQEGKKVVLAAGDTFRAAAGEQLSIWGQRVGADVIRHAEGADPASVVFDALAAAKARKADVLIVDTAGRLHTKTNLMEELKKVRRIIEREIPGAPDETLLILDAVTGQNAFQQARVFHEACPLSGVILTKLEGSAKGGFVVSIQSELGVPVRWVGLGENKEDLVEFDPHAYAAGLIGTADTSVK